LDIRSIIDIHVSIRKFHLIAISLDL